MQYYLKNIKQFYTYQSIKTVVLIIILIVTTTLFSFSQKTVRYDLYVNDTMVNFTGKYKHALAVNGQIPMPTLIFTEGDTAEIYVHNLLDAETTLHWHGLFLPNKEDGVPFVTQMPIKPHTTHLYKFPLIQNGTHWYHGHIALQEQLGLYGAFVILKKKDDPSYRKTFDDMPSVPVIFSEWTDIKPATVNRMLHYNSEYFAIKKNTTQSYAEAAQSGYLATKFLNEWKRMDAMDVNDVYYPKILLNGKPQTNLTTINGRPFIAGDKIRLRLINGGASSYFWVNYSGGKFVVVANDGNDVEPVEVDRLILGNGETFDIIVTIKSIDTAYELLATNEDRTNSTSLFLGNGFLKKHPPLPPLKYYEGMKMMNGMMTFNGNVDLKGMQKLMQSMMSMNPNSNPMQMSQPMSNPSHKMDMNPTENMMLNPTKSTKSKHPNSMDMTKTNLSNSESTMQPDSLKSKHSGMDMTMDKNMDMNMDMQESKNTKIESKQNHNHTQMSMDNATLRMDMNILLYPEITGYYKSSKHSSSHSSHLNTNIPEIVTLDYGMLKSTQNTTLPQDAPVRELKFVLEGNMFRYVWSMDNKVLSETDKIIIKKGENVRITLFNNSMMRHPMHLHGHDFRLINGQGEYSPLKNTVDILPGQTEILEFNANVEGDWIFHCHILYHLVSGMGRVFRYQNQAPNPLIPNPKIAQRRLFDHDRKFYFRFEDNIVTNSNVGTMMIQNTRWSIGTQWRVGYNNVQGYESETHIGRYFGKMQWLMPFIGFDVRYRTPKLNDLGNVIIDKNLFGQTNTKDDRKFLSLGLEYTLPMLVILQGELYMNGNLRLQLMRDGIPITKRLRGSFIVNTDKEYTVSLNYILGKNIGLSAVYDNDLGFGLGFYINN